MVRRCRDTRAKCEKICEEREEATRVKRKRKEEERERQRGILGEREVTSRRRSDSFQTPNWFHKTEDILREDEREGDEGRRRDAVFSIG